MYITNAKHFLNDKGAIGPMRGPARKMAEFLGNVIIAATLPDPGPNGPQCIKCKGAVEVGVSATHDIQWRCPACAQAGLISNWRCTVWDMTTIRDTPHS